MWFLEHTLRHSIDRSKFQTARHIDLLLGAQVFMKILLIEQQTHPVLQKTHLGCIINGEFQEENLQEIKQHSVQSLFIHQISLVDSQLQTFWELEEVSKPALSTEERECKEHFIANITRDEQGHYIVKLPLRQDACTLGSPDQQLFNGS